MVRDDAVQILRDAIAKHQAVFREYWDSGLWAKADEHWEHIKTLRRIDDSISRKNRS